MSPDETYQRIEASIQQYRNALATYTDTQFALKKAESTWSLGQMCEHLLVAGYQVFFRKIKACLERRSGMEGGNKTPAGEKIFSHNSFPPIKLSPPEEWRGTQLIAQTRQAYAEAFPAFLAEAEQLRQSIAQDGGTYKVYYPLLGMLNAAEWFQVLDMHLRHHLRQKKELEAYLDR